MPLADAPFITPEDRGYAVVPPLSAHTCSPRFVVKGWGTKVARNREEGAG